MRRIIGAILLLALAVGAGGCLWWRPKQTASSVNSSVVRGMVDFSIPQTELACADAACGIYHTDIFGGYKAGEGTSYATPYVAAAAGVLKAADITEPAAIEAALFNYARPLGKGRADQYYGNGMLDIQASLAQSHEHQAISVEETIRSLFGGAGMAVRRSLSFQQAARVEFDSETKHLLIRVAPQQEPALLAELARLGLAAQRIGQVLRVGGNGNLEAIASSLLQKGLALTAEVTTEWHAFGDVPNDPYFSKQWGLLYTGFPQVWADNLPLHEVTIAVLDTGVQMDHPDLAGVQFVHGCSLVTDANPYPNNLHKYAEFNPNDSKSYCWDDNPIDNNGHGTAVTGIIAAVRDNSKGIAGAWHGFNIMPVRVLDSEGDGDDISVAYGIYYAAANGADVINLSLGGRPGTPVHPEIIRAVDYARANGVVVVAAAGNQNDYRLPPPASYAPVIAVGAVGVWGTRAYYSNYGDGLDIVAPGGAKSANLIPTIFVVRADHTGALPAELSVATYADVGANGSYGFTLPTGVYHIYAWIDANLDGIINAGDYMDRSEPQLLRAGSELSGVYLQLAKYDGAAIAVY